MIANPLASILYDKDDNDDQKRLARILLVIILIFWVGSGVLIFLDILWGDRTLWVLLTLGCLFQLIPAYLLFRGKLEASSFTAVGIYILFATASATIGQGIRDYVLIVYPSIILFSGLTLKRRGMIAATALTLLSFAWLTFGDIYGLYTPYKPNPAILFDFIILGILITISSIGVHLLIENLEYTHERTKTELDERKRTEALLYESEKSFKEIFENSPDNIFVFDVCPDNRYRIKKINSTLEKIFNTERANIEGKYLDEIMDAKSTEVISANFRRCIETKAQAQYDEFANLPNKSYSTNLIPIMDENGAVTRLIGISRDITQLKQTESQLRESETFIRNVNNNLASGMVYQVMRLKDGKRKFTYLSDSVQRLYGVTPAQALEDPMLIYGRIYEEDQLRVTAEEEEANRTLSVFKTRARVINPDGSMRWSSLLSNPTLMDDGTTRWDGIELDNTELFLAEEKLRQSREMYRLLAEKISDVIWIYDVIENRTRYISPSVERLRGYTPEEVVAGTMESALSPASFQYVQKNIAARLRDFQNGRREFYVDELEQIRKDGSTVWTEATTNFQFNPENGHIEIYGVSRNISEKRQAREALLDSEERIRQLVESAPYSIFGINQDGTINFANTEAVNLLGYSNEELIGENVDILLPARYKESHASLRKMYLERPYVRQIGDGNSLVAQRKDGTEIPVDIKLSYYQLKDSLQIIAFMQDISERKKAEELLRESEARFRLLFETMVQGVVFQSRSGAIASANPAAERLLGLTLDQMQGRTPMDPRWRMIHEDGSEFPGQEHPAMIALKTREEVRNVILGVYNPKLKDHRWINIHAVPQFKPGEQQPYQVYTTFDDVTERRQINEALKASEMRYRLLAENVSDVIWILDVNEMRFRYVSPSVERLRGYTADEVLQQSVEEVLAPHSFQLLQEKLPIYIQEYLDGHTGFHINQMEQPCKDGSTVWTEATTSFRVNEVNSHLEIYGVSRDITERKLNEQYLKQANHELQAYIKKIEQLRQELQEQAVHDPLTELYNRRYLSEALEREFSRAERELLPISLLIMDIDHFKTINDTYGHPVGDKFLVAIAALLRKNTRGSDIVCRYGGEEFILVLPGAEVQAANARAEQFRTEFAQIRIPHELKDLRITVSMGIASFPVHAAKAEDLIIKADLAMYQSKQNGRDRVTIWKEPA